MPSLLVYNPTHKHEDGFGSKETIAQRASECTDASKQTDTQEHPHQGRKNLQDHQLQFHSLGKRQPTTNHGYWLRNLPHQDS